MCIPWHLCRIPLRYTAVEIVCFETTAVNDTAFAIRFARSTKGSLFVGSSLVTAEKLDEATVPCFSSSIQNLLFKFKLYQSVEVSWE